MSDQRLAGLFTFMEETLSYFLKKREGVDRDSYYADRDKRYILDKCINDIILCMVDIAEECLKSRKKSIPDTYRDTILATYEFVGDSALKTAPLVKHRNETIHLYLKMNWQNIVTVNSKIDDIREYVQAVKNVLN